MLTVPWLRNPDCKAEEKTIRVWGEPRKGPNGDAACWGEATELS